jgi:succinate dehydrogenase / fumarate reductase flavoprotein subunit
VAVTLEPNFKRKKERALRDDDKYNYVAAWEHKGNPAQAQLHKEELIFDNIKVSSRSYK